MHVACTWRPRCHQYVKAKKMNKENKERNLVSTGGVEILERRNQWLPSSTEGAGLTVCIVLALLQGRGLGRRCWWLTRAGPGRAVRATWKSGAG